MGLDINKMKDKLYSNDKNNISQLINAKILYFFDIRNSNYIQLALNIFNKKCNNFIINKQSFDNKSTEIEFLLNSIKLKMIKNTNYLEIKEFKLNDFLSKNYENKGFYDFQIPKMKYELNSIKSKEFIAIKLKVKEEDLITHLEYTAYDINNNQILINNLNEFSEQLENCKCYLFNGFYYANNSLKQTNVSSIEIIERNSIIEDIKFPSNIDSYQNDEMINFKGNIKDLIIEKYIVIMEEFNTKNKIEIKLNYDLIRKINPGGLCEFISFKKISNKTYHYTGLSDIYSENNTYIDLKILNPNDQFYNRIKINNDYFDINNNIINNNILLELNSKDKDLLFEQQFIYEKNINNKVVSSYKFTLEINKGRKNKFCTYLSKNGGYTYQLIFQSKNINSLPEQIKIKTEKNEFI